MKTAKLVISVIEFVCPYCTESISSPTGSHMFTLDEVVPDTVKCDSCNSILPVPARAKKIAEQYGRNGRDGG